MNGMDRYHSAKKNRKQRQETELAVNLDSTSCKHALDCGCGLGNDSAYLIERGYSVHACDIDKNVTLEVQDRFRDIPTFRVSNCEFQHFQCDEASVVIAHASLFFCSPSHFKTFWEYISQKIVSKGVFVGDFLGANDGWVKNDPTKYCYFTEEQVRELFRNFTIEHFVERDEIKPTVTGIMKKWHAFSIVAKKK